MEGLENIPPVSTGSSSKRKAGLWSDSKPSSENGEENSNLHNEDKSNNEEFTVVSRKKRVRKRKGKNKAGSGQPLSKDERQARSYTVSDEDLKLYQERHRVSDTMFKHYLNKRIGFESTRRKKRLNKKEVKNLFSPVRSLCLELLVQVKTKKKLNQEKKIVIENVRKATSSNISWSDIVKGKKQVPSTEKNIAITAKDDKIKRQAEKIRELTNQLKKKDDEIKSLSVKLANLSDRISVLERNEVSRKTRDPYADFKKLASKGSRFCQECLPPSAYIYKKPLYTGPHTIVHGLKTVMCDNCKKWKLFLRAGTFVPIFSYNNDKKSFYIYPEGSLLVEQFKAHVITVYKSMLSPVVNSTRLGNPNSFILNRSVLGNLTLNTFGVNIPDPNPGDVTNFLVKIRSQNENDAWYNIYVLAAKNNLFNFGDLHEASLLLGYQDQQ